MLVGNNERIINAKRCEKIFKYGDYGLKFVFPNGRVELLTFETDGKRNKVFGMIKSGKF